MKRRHTAPVVDSSAPQPQGAQELPSPDLQSAYGNAYVQEMLRQKGALAPQDFDRVQQDRQAARMQLQDKFQIVPDDFVGPRAPNQVTQAEYDKISTQLSDIRLGRSDLKFDFSDVKGEDNRKLLEQQSMDDVVKLLQTAKGREVIEQLAYNKDGKQTTVGLAREIQGDPNRHADLCANVQDPNGPPAQANAEAVPLGPSGRPSDVRVRYAPGATLDLPAGRDGQRKTEPTTSDQVLLHELDHARRLTAGTFQGAPLRTGPKTDLGGYPDSCHLQLDPTKAPRTPIAQDEDTARRTENTYAAERRLLGPWRGDRPSYLAPGLWDGVRPL
jgi:hypothetical protein